MVFELYIKTFVAKPKILLLLLSRNLSVLDSFTEVVDGNKFVKNAICPIQTINIPEQLTKEVTDIFNDGLKEEMKWAEKSVNLIGSDEEVTHTDVLSVSYTKHHLEQCRDVRDKTPAINSILPLIKNASNDINFQAHIMNVAIQYTRYLNEGQGTAGQLQDVLINHSMHGRKTSMGLS